MAQQAVDTDLVILIACFIAAVGFIGRYIWMMRAADDFNYQSVTTQGRITCRWSTMSSGGHRGRWRNEYFLEYSFRVPAAGGTSDEYIQKQSVRKWVYDGMQPGDIVQVRYLPTNPSKSKIFSEAWYENIGW